MRRSASIEADLNIEFAGQMAHYDHVSLKKVTQGNEERITGTIPLKLSDFKIDQPSLLSVPVKNDVPVRIEMTWRKES